MEATYPTIMLNDNGYIKNINIYEFPLYITINSGTIQTYNQNHRYIYFDNEYINNIIIIRNGIISNYTRCFGAPSSGTTAGTVVSNGGIIQNASCYYSQGIIVSSGGSIGTIHVHNSEYASGGSPTLKLLSGGSISTLNIGYAGVYISGGVGTINQSQGFVIVSSNGSITNAYTHGRDFYVSNGAIVNSLTVSNGSGARIFSGGLVSSCTVLGSNVIFRISAGGVVNKLTMSRGKLSTFAGATVNNLMVSSGTGGSATYTMSGTSITNMTIDLAGGSTFNTTIDYLNANRGYIDARSNTIISSADINCRDFILRTGATVLSATYTNSRHGSGAIKVSSGCTISNFSFNWNEHLDQFPTGQLTIYNGGIVSNCAFTNFVVSSGGTMVNNQVIFIPEESMKGENIFGSSIIESGGTGININCAAQYYNVVEELNIYDVHLNAGAYVSGYNVTGLKDIIISSGTTVFNMRVLYNENEWEGVVGYNGTITVESNGYVNYISAYQLADEDGNYYQKHNLIVKSGGTALNVVRKWIEPENIDDSGYYEPTLNITSETGAVITYIDEN